MSFVSDRRASAQRVSSTFGGAKIKFNKLRQKLTAHREVCYRDASIDILLTLYSQVQVPPFLKINYRVLCP